MSTFERVVLYVAAVIIIGRHVSTYGGIVLYVAVAIIIARALGNIMYLVALWVRP